MASEVQTFNSLPRQKLAPSGAVPNHWHFSIRHVPLEPPGDLLFILNPKARYVHVEGPATILSLKSPTAQAQVVAPLLLKAFNHGLGSDSEAPKIAPWTWSTTDPELARALEARLKDLGVREDVRKVGTSNAEENKVAGEEWESFMDQLKFLHLT